MTEESGSAVPPPPPHIQARVRLWLAGRHFRGLQLCPPLTASRCVWAWTQALRPPRRRGRGACRGATPRKGLASGLACHPNVGQRPPGQGTVPTPHRGTGLLPPSLRCLCLKCGDFPCHTRSRRALWGRKAAAPSHCPCPAVSGPRGRLRSVHGGAPLVGSSPHTHCRKGGRTSLVRDPLFPTEPQPEGGLGRAEQ